MGDLRNVIWRYEGLMGYAELNIIENLSQSTGKKEQIVAGKMANWIFFIIVQKRSEWVKIFQILLQLFKYQSTIFVKIVEMLLTFWKMLCAWEKQDSSHYHMP